MDMKLEVVMVPVSDVERAKRFYEKLGFRLDVDIAAPDGSYRAVHLTPSRSEASIIFGKGVTTAPPGSSGLLLAVDDIEVARSELVSLGIEVSEIFHDAGGSLGGGFIADRRARAGGRDPQGRSYGSYASFEDPDGNKWLLQEITERLPGRVWETARAKSLDARALAELLHETEQRHGAYEKTHAKHDWWDWYAPYLSARQSGSTPEQASKAADRYMDEVLQVAAR
jgi:catechol 2,3-dioxygenase-like lactoylglutathione lyase family enzyme